MRAALTRAARGDAALSRPPAAGLPELQSWFAHELGASTPGGDHAAEPERRRRASGQPERAQLHLHARWSGSGQPLLMESPTYWGAILAAAQAGVRVVPVPSGPEGPDPVELARAFDETGARLFYAQPNYANPTGAQWAAGRGEEVLDVVRENGAFLVEDDWAHDFGITTSPVPVAARDDSGHVVYLRSLTKSVSPAIRIAAVIARGPARERILADRAAESMYVSGLLQAAALDVVTQPGVADPPAQPPPPAPVPPRPAGHQPARARPAGPHRAGAQGRAEPLGAAARRDRPGQADPRLRERRGASSPPGREWFPAEPAGAVHPAQLLGAESGRLPRRRPDHRPVNRKQEVLELGPKSGTPSSGEMGIRAPTGRCSNTAPMHSRLATPEERRLGSTAGPMPTPVSGRGGSPLRLRPVSRET